MKRPKSNDIPEGLSVRAFAMTPETYHKEQHTVEAVLATEGRVHVMDWERGAVVEEILLMDGLQNGKEGTEIPLLDSHNRKYSGDQIGSTKIMRVENGRLIGVRQFSQANPRARVIEGMVQEGHLKAGSIGYMVDKPVWVERGQTRKILGREITGPVKVAESWRILEDSTTPVGADPSGKVRSKDITIVKEIPMDKTMAALVALGLKADATDDEREAFVRSLIVKPVEPPKAAPPVIDEKALKAEGAAEERARISAIVELGELAGMRERANALVGEGKNVEEARKILYAEAAKAGKFGGAPAAKPKDEGKGVLDSISTADFAKSLCTLSPF